MPTRIVEWQLPYTWGTGIGIDTNKVISILLREENNLIEVNGDNELYTDLQLAVNITPSSDFPVWVTVGKVLAENWWSQNGLILNWKTTSGDYARWLYWADGKLYFDWGQGTWKQVYYSEEVDALFTALRWELATVAFSGDYNDLINRPAFLQVQADWDETDTDSPAYIKNKPTMPTVNDATLTIQKNWVAVGTFTANSSTNVTANITVPNVINNLTSTSTSDSLSAAQGKILNDKITDLQSIGRFLSLWDATTWLPISFPLDIPYNYRTWDYYLVETVGTSNKRPDWVQYTWTASTVPETDELEIWDMYIYDWQVWLLQINHGKSVSFANLSWQPSDNANLASALNAKANVADLATVATSGSYNDLTNKPTIPSAQVNSDWNATSGVAQILNKPTIPTKTSQLTNDSWFITSAYHDSSKQDVLTPGTWISIANGTISNTWVTSVNWQTWAVTVDEWDSKVFTISDLTSAASLATATQAYTYAYTTGKNAIIRYSNANYVYAYGTTTSAFFTRAYWNWNVGSWTWTSIASIKATVSSWSVTAMALNNNLINVSSSAPSSSTTNNIITLVK